MERANRPLAGVTVLDFGQVYQGPYASLLMAQAGADVIKIEPPEGEPLRRRAPPGKSTTFPIAMLNSNKRAITLNLKHERGRALLFRMAEKGDVLLENFAPGVMDRLGVGWSVLREINPRLIYASGSGYGLSGPDRDNLAMDLTIQAVSGLIAATGFPEGPPVKAGPAVVDFISGIHLYAATLTALFERERTGRGRLVEVAMQEAAYATLTSQLHAYIETGQVPPRTGNASHGRVPLNVYPTNDGYVAMNIAVEEHWHNLLKAMGREDLRDDPRFAGNAARIANREATDALKAKAEAGYRFYALYDKISRESILVHAYAQCRSNKGAPGVDGQDFADIEAHGVERWLAELAIALRQETYRPRPIRRVFIPKANGKLRPLGISTVRDRVCMTAAMLVLEPIFEADLPPEIYAYRVGRNAQQAAVEVEELLVRGHPEVVDADLADSFGSIPHSDLLKSVARRIVDRRVLHLIKMWLDCPVEETGN